MPSSNSEARKRHEERGAALMSVWEVRSEPERLIGLSGWAQSGKDTMGSVLVDRGFTKVGFADGLRTLALKADPVVRVLSGRAPFLGRDLSFECLQASYFYGVEPEGAYEWLKANTTYREFLQNLGTGVREVLGENAWVNALLSKLETGGRYVVTDVRFPNEAEAIRSKGGVVWRVKRPGHTAANDHISEHALDDYEFDRTFSWQNTADMAELRGMMQSVLATLPEVAE